MIISPCKSGYVDPVVMNIIKDADSPIPLVPITKIDDFVFNEELNKVKEYILCDFCEYGWSWPMGDTHLFGINTHSKYPDHFLGDEWERLDYFIARHPPIVYFKRELLKRDASYTVKPIEYPCWHEIPEPDSKEKFNSRMFDVFNSWGLSHEARKTVHGQIWEQSGKHGYVVCDNIININKFINNETNSHKWITVNTPHYARFSMETILAINGNSKISVSLAGAGRKCFRHTESPINSVMYMWEDVIAWAYPWIHNVNCIKSEQGKEIETIMEALNNPNLYEIYLADVENCRKYQIGSYIKNYIEAEIKKVL